MIDLVPLCQFSDRYREGWRLVDGYDLAASDYAATMASPDHGPVRKGNVSIAASSRNFARYQPQEVAKKQVRKVVVQPPKAVTDSRLETLEEENRQLKDRISKLSGYEDAEALQYAFVLTPTESHVLALLVHRGSADYSQLEFAAFPDGRGDDMEDVVGAVRSHIKRLRRKIRPHGIDVNTVYEFGYTMTDDARSAAKRMIAEWKAGFDD